MATNSNKVWTPNSVQSAFLEFLRAHKGEKFTLAEISAQTGVEIKSGSVNSLTKGEHTLVKCNKNEREIVCACCGHKTKVSTWEIISNDEPGDTPDAE